MDGGGNERGVNFVEDLYIKDIMLMVLNFYVKHNLTQAALEDLLQMLNIFTRGNVFPESFKTFNKLFPDPYNSKRAYFCSNCLYG